jgi:glycerophosphoryl diester phosphodiesterase
MRRAMHPAVAGGPLLVAHRGGSLVAPENTLTAFRSAVTSWAADMIELDVRATADGHCVVIHDATLDRTTDGTGPVSDRTLAELKEFDAGYHFTPDGGHTFPFRGQGIRIPTIAEVLSELPALRITAEVKAAAAQRPLFEAIRVAGAEQRIVAASLRLADRTHFNEYKGPKSACIEQVRPFYALSRVGLGRVWAPKVDVMQLPEFDHGRRIVGERLIRDLHAHGIAIQVWTVNDASDMRRLLEWGVDGVQSDRPDLLAQVLTQMYGRPHAPACR